MKVVVTQSAKADLQDIADYIAKDSPRRAVTFTDELLDAAEALGEFSKSYPLIPRYERQGHRRRPYGRYLIFYRIMGGEVVIDHFLHGAQDYESILFPDD